MPKRDIYHYAVKNALIKDGWIITHDPFVLSYGRKRLFADLGASRLISAEKKDCRIVVEIKSFLSDSDIYDLEQTIGQYVLYAKILAQEEKDRLLYVAVTQTTFEGIFSLELGELLLADQTIQLVVFDEKKEVIIQWLPKWNTNL